MKKLLQKYLKFLASKIIKKYQPKIIGITGSVGKTSTKEAVFTAIRGKYKVRTNIKNYNNEIGLPLTIIGSETGGKNIFKWVGITFKALGLILGKKDYPEVLILEMGIDHPGDMSYLMSFVTPDIGVVTAIGDQIPVHVEFFKDVEHLVKEKRVLVEKTKPEGLVFLNRDDNSVYVMKDKVKAQVLTFGFHDNSDLKATDIKVITKFPDDIDKQQVGLNFKLSWQGSVVPVFLPGVLGQHQIYSVLVGVLVGLNLGMNIVEATTAIKDFKSPKGRMNLIKGIKHTLLIDDSYNASPPAVVAAVKVLSQVQVDGKKWAIIGNMAELGQYTTRGHNVVGEEVYKQDVDYLVTIGESAKIIANKAIELGMEENSVYSFSMSEEAGEFIQQKMKKGDILLIKGSQSIRAEKIVKEIMAEPLKAKDLLVRQEGKWLKS